MRNTKKNAKWINRLAVKNATKQYAEGMGTTEHLGGMKELCNSDLLSSNPEIRSLVKGFIDSVLDGTLFKQQALQAQQSIKALQQSNLNS